MSELIIKTESDLLGEILSTFLFTYKEQICEYINLELRDKGQLADSGIIKEKDGSLSVVQVADEKGYVLSQTDAEPAFEIKKYSEVKEDQYFLSFTKKGLTLILKSEKGIPDAEVGQFKNFDDAFTEINTPAVAQALEATKASKKAQVKQLKRLMKLGKIDNPNIEDATIVDEGANSPSETIAPDFQPVMSITPTQEDDGAAQ